MYANSAFTLSVSPQNLLNGAAAELIDMDTWDKAKFA